MRPASCGLATMESGNGVLCRTGRVVEANIDLRGGPVGIGRARGRRRSDPEAISVYVRSKAPGAVRIGLETGPTSTWLWTELKRFGLPVICIDARHAKAVLKMQINKSDRNDAIGIARIVQTGWFKEVHVKDIDSHSVRALLASRALLVKIKRDLENHVRGLLKNLGLVIGCAKFNVFAVRAEELIEGPSRADSCDQTAARSAQCRWAAGQRA